MSSSDTRSRGSASFLQPQTWTLDALTHAVVVGSALLGAHFAKAFSDLSPSALDFALFYSSVRAWRAAGSLYEQAAGLINYNAPQFHILVLPLASIPLPIAFAIWTAINAGAAVLTVRIAMREAAEQWTMHDRRLVLAAVLLAAGVGATVHLGQVSWLIALLVTLGWKAARRARWATAGGWLGVAVSLKPFLLLVLLIFTLRRQWIGLATAIVVAALCLGAGVLVFGAGSFVDWLHLLATHAPTQQVRYFINASLAAPLARAGLGHGVFLVIGLSVAAVTVLAARTADVDRAFSLLLIGSLLASPLGWIYYMPILIGPVMAMAIQQQLRPSTWWAWPLLACPAISRDFLQFNGVLSVTLGSAYAWGLAILWFAAARASAPSTTTESRPVARQLA